MGSRVQLHNLLKTITDNVYFNPPPSVIMEYPCIRYKRNDISIVHAGDNPYKSDTGYQIIVIDSHPDGNIYVELAKLKGVSYERAYIADNLYHDVFNIYY